jgi:hypothetical protein
MGQIPETDAAEPELSIDPARPTANLTPPHRSGTELGFHLRLVDPSLGGHDYSAPAVRNGMPIKVNSRLA